jgi:hypothetical protein
VWLHKDIVPDLPKYYNLSGNSGEFKFNVSMVRVSFVCALQFAMCAFAGWEVGEGVEAAHILSTLSFWLVCCMKFFTHAYVHLLG